MRRKALQWLRLLSVPAVVLCLSGRLPAQATAPGASKEWEYKAVALGKDEGAATRKLNELAGEGWRYVGPLGHGLTAFQRPSPLTAAARQELQALAGKWQLVSLEEDGKQLLTAEFRPASLILRPDGQAEEVWPRTTMTYAITVNPAATPKRMTRTLSASNPMFNREGIYKLEGDRLTLCLAPVGMGGRDQRRTDLGKYQGFRTWDMALGVPPPPNTEFTTHGNYCRLEVYERVKNEKK